LIIVNPAAGRRHRSRRRLASVVAALERRGCSVIIRQTTAASGDAERLAREAEAKFDVIVAAGGDGTIQAVANGIIGSSQAFAVLPLGTANVLAREIDLPHEPQRLAELIADRTATPVWLGRADDRLFLTTASSGFDAETVEAVNPRLKRHLGRLAFAWAIAQCWCRYRPCELRVRIDGIDHRATTVIAAKGRFYAGSYVVAPSADLAEPMLDFVLFRRSGRLAVSRYLVALLSGRLPWRRDITCVRGRQALVSADKPLPVQADGEIIARLPVVFTAAEQPLLLIRP
jgi:diacylglycerol kinase (ATP)